MSNYSHIQFESAKKLHNKSKDKLATMLDSTAVTAKLFGDSTMNINKTNKFDFGKDSLSIIQPLGLTDISAAKKFDLSDEPAENKILPEIRKSLNAEYMESLSPRNLALSPRLNRHFEKVKQFLKSNEEMTEELAFIQTDETQVDPKHIELWIGHALRESLKKGYVDIAEVDSKTNILKVFGVDRETLKANDVKNINRLYRALYVYSVGFYQLIKEPLEGCKNKNATATALWKVYSVLLQYVCKTQYSMVVANLTKAYRQDVTRLEDTLSKNKHDYELHRDILEGRVDNLESEVDDLKYQIEQLTETNAELSEENRKYKETMEEEKLLRSSFEDKVGYLQKKVNDYESQIKILKSDLEGITEDHKTVKANADSQISTLASLNADKIKLERMVANYQAEATMLKEEIMGKSSVINQRDRQLNDLHKEMDELLKEIQVHKKTIEEKNIKINVIQAKIMDKKQENDEREAYINKIKRANVICEDRIKTLHEKLTEVSGTHEKVCIDYESLKVKHEHLTEENKAIKLENVEFSEKLKLCEDKYDGLDVRYKNLSEHHQIIKDDYDKTCDTLEEINKSRNSLFDEVNSKNTKINDLNRQIESLDHLLYQEKSLATKLQERLTD